MAVRQDFTYLKTTKIIPNKIQKQKISNFKS